MSYAKTNWVDGQTPLNAENMNHIEEGIEANAAAIGQLSEDIVAHGETLDGVSREVSALSQAVEEVEGTSLASITRESTNLATLEGITAGYAIDGDGTLTANDKYHHSEYIAIMPNEKYITRGAYAVAFYDANKTFMHRIWSTAGQAFATPSNARYLRISTDVHPRTWQLNKGETLLTYDNSYKILDKVRLPKGLTASEDAVIFSGNIDQYFKLTESPVANFDIYNTTAAQVYEMYDALMAQHSQYITKEVLGNDASGNSIAVYKLTPEREQIEQERIPEALRRTPKIPTVFINCAIHGNEHSSAFVTYLFVKDMCEKWANDEVYEVLRHDVDYLIIPVANPYGWNEYTRGNSNGVDINRNFPYGFNLGTAGTNEYGGEYPLSELESQYIKYVLDSNNIDVVIDFHETALSSSYDQNLINWISTANTYSLHLAQNFSEKITREIKKEYEWAAAVDAQHSYTQILVESGMLKDEAVASGIKFASSYEVISKWGLYEGAANFDAIHAKTTLECFVNFLLYNLRQVRHEYRQMSEYAGS